MFTKVISILVVVFTGWTAAYAANHELNSERLSKLLGLPSGYWASAAIGSDVARALDLSQEEIHLPQLEYRDSEGHLHLFYRLPNDRGFIIAVIRADKSGIAFKTDRTFLLEVAIVKKQSQTPVPLPFAQAQRELRTELAVWAQVADAIPK